MKIGIVISTFGTPAFIHLQLAIAKKLYPALPIAVVDDSSTETAALSALCEEYKATFFADAKNPAVNDLTRDPRTGGISAKHCLGDLSALCRGFHWAKANGFDVLVKLSRRFVPLYDWTSELTRIVLATHYPAYSSWDSKDGFPFKTEAAAYMVGDWFRYGAVEEIERQASPVFMEGFLWEINQRIWKEKCRDPVFARTDRIYTEGSSLCYGHWFIGGIARDQQLPWRLWHVTNTAAEYLRVAKELGIDANYTEADFPSTLKQRVIVGSQTAWNLPVYKSGVSPKWV